MASRYREPPSSGRYPRTARINEVLREVLAEEIERSADSDERLRMVTVTGVDVAADLKNATVFVSTIDGDAGEALGEHRAELQSVIARQVHIKRTPRLSFVIDPALVEGERIERILRRIKAQDVAHSPDDAGG
jgi:ribosome-binding factor A